MKIIFAVVIIMLSLGTMAQSTNIYDNSFTDIDGNEIGLKQFEGKKILFVNVASECGYTNQYEDLQKLHEEYGDKIILIGFPCDQFGGQEPGDEAEIKSFCQKNYGVDFLMASKIDVKGESQHTIYAWLTTEALNGVENSKVAWNFNKYLVDETGKYIAHFPSGVNPMDEKITSLLQ